MGQYAKASAFGGGGGGGSGDVVGPASAADNAIARYDSTTGKLIQNSSATIDDSGNLTANNISGTNTGDQTITLTGGVTGSGTGSFAATVITNANLTGDVTSVGNATTLGTVPVAKGGTGATTATAGFDALSPMTTGGDILYGGASGTATRLANGTAGQVLTSNGTTAAPTWTTPAGTGDVVGPASATDNAIARYDSTTGKLLQNSGANIDDSGFLGINSTDNATLSATMGPEIVVKNTTSGARAGVTVYSATDGEGGIYFTDTGTYYQGRVEYNHSTEVLSINNSLGDGIDIKDESMELTVGVSEGANLARLHLDSSGIGIGDNSAVNYYLPVTDGTTSQVLETDGFGAVSWVTPSGLSDPMTTRGDVIIRDATNTTARLAVGTNTQVLVSDGTDIAWGTNTAAVLTFDVESKAANFTAASGKMYLVSSAAARAITMPAASAGAWFRVKDSTGDCNTNNFTLTRAGSESIEGIAANKVLQTNWGSWTVVSDGTNWFLING